MNNQAHFSQADLASWKIAYEQAIYEAYYGQETIQIKIGEYCPRLDCLISQSDRFSWAFVTAANPYSQILSASENQQRHQGLIKYLTKLQFLFLPGLGKDPNEIWTPEPSLLVFGIERSQAIALGQKFFQNAIVYGQLRQPVELQWVGITPDQV